MNESRITRSNRQGNQGMKTRRKRLNEKELGTLYAYCGAPLRLHHMLEKDFPKAGDAAAISVFDATPYLGELHDSLSAQGPDDALLSLSLMGWIIEDYCSYIYSDAEALRPLCAEMKSEAENVIHDLGRLRIDLDSYRAEISDKEIFDHLKGVPDSLCVLASVFAELQEAFRDMGRKDMAQISRLLCYQAESQADYAWRYVEMMAGKESDQDEAALKPDIPLPFDMQPEQDSQKIIDLSLFRRR